MLKEKARINNLIKKSCCIRLRLHVN